MNLNKAFYGTLPLETGDTVLIDPPLPAPLFATPTSAPVAAPAPPAPPESDTDAKSGSDSNSGSGSTILLTNWSGIMYALHV